ncbi:MAG: ABC transporter permease [Coriobacteriia bacterium]|nr:ABC transporter permease [Coriobacteriia bacterium]
MKINNKLKGYLILIFLVVVSWAIFKIVTPNNFGAPEQMLQYFETSLLAATGAIGFYFVIVMGMFDFSIGANIILSSIVGCVLGTTCGFGYFGFIFGSILCGALVGLINGTMYTVLRIPSMIVTAGLALIYEALANFVSGGAEQILPSDLRFFGSMPGNIILAACAFVIAYILLNYTKLGTYTYAIGSNELMTKNMGIQVNKYKILAFVISGAFFGIQALLSISYGTSVVAVTGMTSMARNFAPTMGCFFGLAFRKYGIPLQAIIIGQFFLSIVTFGFIALGAATAVQDVITGFMLLVIIALTTRVMKGEVVK